MGALAVHEDRPNLRRHHCQVRRIRVLGFLVIAHPKSSERYGISLIDYRTDSRLSTRIIVLPHSQRLVHILRARALSTGFPFSPLTRLLSTHIHRSPHFSFGIECREGRFFFPFLLSYEDDPRHGFPRPINLGELWRPTQAPPSLLAYSSSIASAYFSSAERGSS